MSLSDEKKIEAVILLEVLGRPPEHVTNSLNEIIKSIAEEPGITVKEKLMNEPAPLKEEKELFTAFAEVEIEVETLMKLLSLLFKYMPSHVEIIEPEDLKMKHNDWNELLNELTRRLHAYDEVARIMQNENIILEKKLREILGKTEKDKEE
ncbi:MAG: hypothetical protein AABW63_03810 [Nanoarchaeota archaeon]